MKTEKRYAEVGERILIVNTTPDESFGDYEEGDILTVTGHRYKRYKQEGKVLVNVPGSASVWPREYRVIIGEETEV